MIGLRFISFWWKISSEEENDLLEVTVNGVLADTPISGERNWRREWLILPDGTNTVRWRYVKNSSYSEGSDAAWLDEVSVRLPATLVLSNLSRVYDGTSQPVHAMTSPPGLPVVVTYDDDSTNPPINADTYHVTATIVDPVYGEIVTETLTIAPAPLTVTVQDQSRPTGFPNPPLTIQYSGFVNGEDADVLESLPVAETPASPNSPPGAYPITLTVPYAENYILATIPGTLTVTNGPLVIISLTNAGTTNALVTWTSIRNRVYQLQYRPALNGPWLAPGADVTATNWTASAKDPAGNQPQRFYRVSQLPGPPDPPAILSVTGGGSTNVVITWSAISNLAYQVQYVSALGTPWIPLVPNIVAVSNTAFIVDHPVGSPQRFYRVMIVP